MQALTSVRRKEKQRERMLPSKRSYNKPRKHPNGTITTAFNFAGNCPGLSLVLEQLVKVIIHTLKVI
jgi:hypothetical protein